MKLFKIITDFLLCGNLGKLQVATLAKHCCTFKPLDVVWWVL